MENSTWDERFWVSGEIVARGIARNELSANAFSPDDITREVLEMGPAPLFFRILALGETVDDAAVEAIAKRVAQAAR